MFLNPILFKEYFPLTKTKINYVRRLESLPVSPVLVLQVDFHKFLQKFLIRLNRTDRLAADKCSQPQWKRESKINMKTSRGCLESPRKRIKSFRVNF